MLYHIFQGSVRDYRGSQNEIIYLVSTAEKIQAEKIPFVFTDRHAYLNHKVVYNSLHDLGQLSWNIIKDDTWFQNYSALRKELKQAEFLVFGHLPVNALLGIVCQNDQIANFVRKVAASANVSLPIAVRPDYYYT